MTTTAHRRVQRISAHRLNNFMVHKHMLYFNLSGTTNLGITNATIGSRD